MARFGVFRRHPPGETSAFAVRHYTDLEEDLEAVDLSNIAELEAERDCEGEVSCASDHERGDPAIGTRGLSRARGSDSSIADRRQVCRDLGEL